MCLFAAKLTWNFPSPSLRAIISAPLLTSPSGSGIAVVALPYPWCTLPSSSTYRKRPRKTLFSTLPTQIIPGLLMISSSLHLPADRQVRKMLPCFGQEDIINPVGQSTVQASPFSLAKPQSLCVRTNRIFDCLTELYAYDCQSVPSCIGFSTQYCPICNWSVFPKSLGVPTLLSSAWGRLS